MHETVKKYLDVAKKIVDAVNEVAPEKAKPALKFASELLAEEYIAGLVVTILESFKAK